MAPIAWINAVIAHIARAMMWLATLAGISLTALVALASFMRYLVGAPLAFTEELVGLLFSAMVFLALPYCSLHGKHICVTLVSDSLPPAWRVWSARGATLLVLIFCVCYFAFAYDFAALSKRLRAMSDIGRITLWPWMAVIPLACALMAVATLLRHGRRKTGDDKVP